MAGALVRECPKCGRLSVAFKRGASDRVGDSRIRRTVGDGNPEVVCECGQVTVWDRKTARPVELTTKTCYTAHN
jgi:hypothetical protein